MAWQSSFEWLCIMRTLGRESSTTKTSPPFPPFQVAVERITFVKMFNVSFSLLPSPHHQSKNCERCNKRLVNRNGSAGVNEDNADSFD